MGRNRGVFRMRKINVKQGTLEWEKLRTQRIGSGEIYDIVRYYATDTELQNCGINAEEFRKEKPYTTAWALYHKMLNDGLYHKEALEPEFAEYGHAVEPYGVYKLQEGRRKKLKPGGVYMPQNRLIASLDIEGVAEEIDEVPFNYGNGKPLRGQKFVCEQKTMMPQKVKDGIPFKYIIQAQYQIVMTKADFYMLQIMVLDEDTPFIRGKICQMSKKKRFEYLDNHLSVNLVYFRNNEHLARLIETCIGRFFVSVESLDEPMPYLGCDNQANVLECVRINSAYNDKRILEYDISQYVEAKKRYDIAKAEKQRELQKIIEQAVKNNVCKFGKDTVVEGFFSKKGSFLLKTKAEEGTSL